MYYLQGKAHLQEFIRFHRRQGGRIVVVFYSFVLVVYLITFHLPVHIHVDIHPSEIICGR